MAKNNIEDNFKELDELLEKMQDEDVSLDESFEMYKKGIEIVKDSNEQIDKIEKQIEVLEEELDDE
ncbi:MAG: exodeoxyribonuclease VII small subunit [Eubacterium sp.]|nr:exodeoxyribonuclease VII small subunit [Eubacterium sp.]